MALDLLTEKGTPLERQQFTWRDLVKPPISKLDDDAFTRCRIILQNGVENEAIRFSHSCARMNKELQIPLAQLRRVEQFQQIMVNWLNPGDQSPLETTIGFEQVAIEVTAHVAENEPDPYIAQVFRFGLLEDFDHLYRFSALMDRVEGRDSNSILQCYTDIMPGRPTSQEHRAPEDDIRNSYDKNTADPLTKLHCLTIVSAEHQVHDYYSNIGPLFADPVARQLYAEILTVEEQHVTQYESIIDASETWLEKWLMHEAHEVYTYYSCMQQEKNQQVKAIWERFVDYELGHLQFVRQLFEKYEKRDAAELLPKKLPDPIDWRSHREFIRQTLRNEVDLRTRGPNFIQASEETPDSPSVLYRNQMNSEGSPSEIVAAGYKWIPGTELVEKVEALSGNKR
jgi:rubrerythrin